MPKIHTHQRVDLDAVASVWAVKKFVPGFNDASEVVFHPANWNGEGMEEGDIAVDIEAGGRGIKGSLDEKGGRHASFETLVYQFASPEDQAALFGLVYFIDIQDTYGNVVNFLLGEDIDNEARAILGAANLNVVLRALQYTFDFNDEIVLERMSEIFDGIRQMRRLRQLGRQEANKARILPGRQVAIVYRYKKGDLHIPGVHSTLFSRGIKAIVYVDDNNVGIVTHESCPVRADHPRLRQIVSEAGEGDKWFAHSNGRLFCWGSRKSPRAQPSRVSPLRLAQEMNDILREYDSQKQ